MALLWKVCGMREEDNILEVLALQPDFMGFIFYPRSKRNVSGILSEDLLKKWSWPTRKVGVFVNENLDKVIGIVQKYELNLVQLHGEESPEFCKALSKNSISVMKAFAVDEGFDFNSTSDYEGLCEYFLFDTKAPGGYGGHGKAFDWTLLKKYKGNTPFLIAGGVDEYNVSELASYDLPLLAGIDVNSRFENRPAFKIPERLDTLKSKLQLFSSN